MLRNARFVVVPSLLLSLAGPAPAAEERLEELVVTAPPVESALAAPASVSVIPGQDLESNGVPATQELTARAPALVVHQGGDRQASFISVRGVADSIFGEPAVGLYVDDVPYNDIRSQLLDLFDVERIEVFRGPQTTRFAHSAEAGAIRMVTRGPDPVLRADGSVSYGDFDAQTYRGAASGPLGTGGRAFFSVAGFEDKRGGYIENRFLDEPLDDRESFGGRMKFLLLPVPHLQIALTGEARHADDAGAAFVRQHQPDPFTVSYDERGRQRTDDGVGAMRLVYEAPSFHATSVTARRSFDSVRSAFDGDLTPRDLVVVQIDHHVRDWTEELRLSSPRERRWRWLLGGFFERRTTETPFAARLDDTARIQAPPPVGPGLPFTAPVYDRQDGQFRRLTWAPFGRTSLPLRRHLRLEFELRYEDASVRLARSHVLIAPAQGRRLPVVGATVMHTHSAAWLPAGTLAYRPLRRFTVYGTIARGYRAGGLSHLTDDPAQAHFAPQFELSYEVGVKGAARQDAVRGGLALYYIRGRDYQDQQRLGFSSFTVRNAQSFTSRGADVQLAVRPASGLEMAATFGWTDAHYGHYRIPRSHERFDGNRIAVIPEYDFSLAGEYRHPRGLVARVETIGVGAYPFLSDGVREQGAYRLVNARFGWGGRHLGMYLFGRNLTDTVYFPFAFPGGPGGDYVAVPGAPRTFGAAVSARF